MRISKARSMQFYPVRDIRKEITMSAVVVLLCFSVVVNMVLLCVIGLMK